MAKKNYKKSTTWKKGQLWTSQRIVPLTTVIRRQQSRFTSLGIPFVYAKRQFGVFGRMRSTWLQRLINAFLYRGKKKMATKLITLVFFKLKWRTKFWKFEPLLDYFEWMELYRVPFVVTRKPSWSGSKYIYHTRPASWWTQYSRVVQWLRTEAKATRLSSLQEFLTQELSGLDLRSKTQPNSKIYDTHLGIRPANMGIWCRHQMAVAFAIGSRRYGNAFMRKKKAKTQVERVGVSTAYKAQPVASLKKLAKRVISERHGLTQSWFTTTTDKKAHMVNAGTRKSKLGISTVRPTESATWRALARLSGSSGVLFKKRIFIKRVNRIKFISFFKRKALTQLPRLGGKAVKHSIR